MDWKKEDYLITRMQDGEMVRSYVSGIVTEIDGLKIGIHKDRSWIVTDLRTGYLIHADGTQKACKEWVEAYSDIVVEMITKLGKPSLIEKVEKCEIVEL